MMKGGAGLRLDLDEGWCETLRYIAIHHKRIDIDEGWCETLHYLTIHHEKIDLDEGWCETLHCITIHHKGIDLDAGWCETLHYITVCFGEEAGARNLVFFRVKWLQPAMKGTSCVRRLRLGSFRTRVVRPSMCLATSGCSCVRWSMHFLKLWLQIALEWLHECCMSDVLGRKPEHETLCFSV